MKKIIIYVSDHGFGHATRTIGLVRKLDNKKISIALRNLNSFDLLKTSLPNISITKIRTDVGPVFDENLNYNNDKTFTNISEWISNEAKWISQEYSRIKEHKPDLIISDISPIAIRLTEKIRCPSIAISNFSWIDILGKMPNHEKKRSVLKWLQESFSMSDFAIKLAPSMNMSGFPKTRNSSILCRDITETKMKTLERLQVRSSPIVTYFGSNTPEGFKIKNQRYPIVTMKGDGIFINNRHLGKIIEGQNLISSSRVVIAKSGYSTMAECMKFKHIMFTARRKDYPEDQVLCTEGKKMGIVKIINSNDVIKIPTRKELQHMEDSINHEMIKKMEELPHPAEIISEFIRK